MTRERALLSLTFITIRLRNVLSLKLLIALAAASFWFARFAAFAQAAETSVPSPSDPPVTLKSCEVDSSGPEGRRAEVGRSAAVGRVYISFVNQGNVAATQVHLVFFINGLAKAEGTLNGTYQPNIAISTHQYENSALAPITDPEGLTCKVTYVKFKDGTEWRSAAASGTILAQPDSPVLIQECSIRLAGETQKPFIVAAITFKNRVDKPIGVVKFLLTFFDAFDTQLFQDTYTVSGHFAPDAVIAPYTNSVSGGFVYDPSSPAWAIYNARPDEVATAKCGVAAVRYVNGDIWRYQRP